MRKNMTRRKKSLGVHLFFLGLLSLLLLLRGNVYKCISFLSQGAWDRGYFEFKEVVLTIFSGNFWPVVYFAFFCTQMKLGAWFLVRMEEFPLFERTNTPAGTLPDEKACARERGSEALRTIPVYLLHQTFLN